MTAIYRLMVLARQLGAEDGGRRDGACIRRLLAWGYSADAIGDGLRGLAAARDGKLSLPEGALGWLHRGQAFGAQLLIFRDLTSGRRVVDLAGDAWRTAQPQTDRTGLARLTVGRIG